MRVLVAFGCLILVACPPKKPTELPGDAATPAVGDPVAVPGARDPITACPNEPAWMAWAPCKTESGLYVVGKAPGAGPLARNTAMNRARAELVRLGIGEKTEDGEVTLRGTEAFDSFSCNEETYGLAALTGDGFAQADPAALALVPTSCAGVVLEAEEDPEAACPAWTRRGAWREGDAIFAVGSVAGMKNRALASNTARTRAMAEAQKMGAITVKVSDTGVSSRSGNAAALGVPTDVEMAECDGVLYTRVKLEHVR